MLLTFDKGYADYTDTQNWLPWFRNLKELAEVVDTDVAATMADSQLLDTMEKLDELMRYYCSEHDFANLEPVMRKFNDLLGLCRSRGIAGVECAYLEMLFLRINALLYRAHGQKRQAATQYDKCMAAAENCFRLLHSDEKLDDGQVLYVGWNCVECFREAAETNDSILNAAEAIRILRAIIPMLERLEAYLPDYPGICDQTAELYTNIAGMLYQYQDYSTADNCYNKAIDLFNGLDRQTGSDFYRARAIWIYCTYGLMDFLQRGNPKIMLACEEEADEYLMTRRFAKERDTAIVKGAKGMVMIQKGVAFQQNGQLSEAIRLAEAGCKHLEHTMEVLENDYKPRKDYYRTVVYRIAVRVYHSYVGALDGLGVMYYQNEDISLAEQTFSKTLNLLTDSDSYSMGESGAVLIRSEANLYMALIASDKADAYQAVYYGTQAADLALEMAEQTGNPAAWDLAVTSCCLTSEVHLNMKDKPKALIYADKGLLACDNLARVSPQNPKLELRSMLSKFRKKASRKFF